MSDQNSTCFFYEICNMWQSYGNMQKNFQCFFIFSNNKDETYYKVPNLSLKIRTKSDYDNTEVKLWASFDSLPDLIYTIKNYLNNRNNTSVSIAGHRYTFYIANVPSPNGGDFTCIRLGDSNENTNDFVMATSTLTFITNTLEKACEDIIKLSLDFIKIAQNNDILNRLTSIEDVLKYNKNTNIIMNMSQPEHQPGDVWYGQPTTSGSPTPPPMYTTSSDVDTTQMTDEQFEEVVSPSADTLIPESMKTIITESENLNDVPPWVESTNMMPGETSGNINTEEVPLENQSSDKPELQAGGMVNPDDMMPVEDVKEFDTPTSIENKQAQDVVQTIVKGNLDKSPIERIKEKIIKIISETKSPYTILQEVFNEVALIDGNADFSFHNASKYFYTTFSTYERYFKKLSLICDLHKQVTEKVPLFTINTRLSNLYVKETANLNSALIDLYLHSRETRTSELDEKIYACLRYVFAPFWSSFIANSPDIDNCDNALLKAIKQLTLSELYDWEKKFDQKIDMFIYNNKLAIDPSGHVVDQIFHVLCPTLYECLKEVNENTPINNVNMVRDIITQLKETFAYQEVTYKEWYDLNALSDNFIKTMRIFSKDKKINLESDTRELFDFFSSTIEKMDANNIRNEFKALTAIDQNDTPLVKKSDIKPPVEVSKPVEITTTTNEISVDIQTPANNNFNPADMIGF